jgi:succinate-semialdehyde dehydrogenase/glutarate-semialdehyde dehydrogenase
MHPHGVIGVISPWNYPLTLAVSDFIPALIAGNTVVLKPDLQTSLTALWAINLLRESGVPEQVVQVVLGEGADVGPHIVARADYVMFTGSTRAGRIVAAQAAERLIGSSMELGGKNSLIVDKSVDLDFAAEIAARGAFANAGQLCIGTERIVVHQDVYDKFVTAFAAKVSNLKVGAAIGWGADLGTLTHPRQLATTQQHIADAVERGATIVVGGGPLPELSPLAFQPTVLADVPEDALACREETFGPVCSLYRWSNERDLVKFVNNTPYGLNAAIISKDLKFAYRLAPQLKVGTVNINEAFGSAYASIDAPMGGMGQSGLGRRHGAYGLLKYTEPQTISRQRWMKLSPQWNLDDAGWAKFTTVAMQLLKFLGFR